jgi:hypothetical protein
MSLSELTTLIAEGRTAPDDWLHISLEEATWALSEAKAKMRQCRKPESKIATGKLIRLCLQIRARRWSEKSEKDFKKHLENTRGAANSERTNIYNGFYLELLLAEQKRLEKEKKQEQRQQRGEAAKNFHSDLVALCEKYQLCAVPTHGGEPSAHDPMNVVPLNDFWRNYLKERIYQKNP